MKVTLVHRYFWPDTPPYAVMLRHIAGQFARDGYDVTVISTQPSYKTDFKIETQPWVEPMDGFTVKRLKLKPENRESLLSRFRGMLGFSFKLFMALLKEKPDVMSIATTPQILGGVVIRLASAATGARYIYHCQDIYPEVANVSGFLKTGPILSFLRYIDRKTCDNAFATIVLSEDMRDALLQRGCHGRNIHIINNFELVAVGHSEKPVVSEHDLEGMVREEDKFRVIFAGNIGRFQGLEAVIEAANKLSDLKNVEFVFLGEGHARKQLELQAGDLLDQSVKFFGHQPLDIARKLIADSQLCIISLSKGVYKYAYPSKTMTYMCEGVPVAVIAELNSQLSQAIANEGLGVVASPGEADQLAEGIRIISADRDQWHVAAENVRNYAERNFKVSSVLPKWSKLLENGEKNG